MGYALGALFLARVIIGAIAQPGDISEIESDARRSLLSSQELAGLQKQKSCRDKSVDVTCKIREQPARLVDYPQVAQESLPRAREGQR